MSEPVAPSAAGSAPPRPGTPKLKAAMGGIIQTDPSLEALWHRVTLQTMIIGGLGLIFVLALPFSRPVYSYFALNPEKKVMRMVGLDMPNMTNRAVLSWSTTSITEVMTMGFGDFNTRMPKQRIRFTPRGWEAYQKALDSQGISEAFHQSQLVLTTVPSNTPVIVAQGVNEASVYQWIVQMPVIMTYATNNNVMRKEKRIVTLTLTRVEAEDNPFGLAIHSWFIE